MKPMNLDQVVRNIDGRLDRVEQILPTLPTREEMHAALNSAIRDAVAPLATSEELDRKIAPLATKNELREEFERSRRHTEVLFESLLDRINIIADGFATTQTKIDQDIHPRLADHDRRITALEDSRGRASGGRRSSN
jgi:hypothetical protein